MKASALAPAVFSDGRSHKKISGLAWLALSVFLAGRASAQITTTNLVVNSNTYVSYALTLQTGAWVYVDANPAASSPVRATQRTLGHREAQYKAAAYATLAFRPVASVTNGTALIYDYQAQSDRTNTVGFWSLKDIPFIIGPDGQAYATDGHHTTAGYLLPASPVRLFVPGLDRIILGHIVANHYDPLLGPQPVTDAWWQARAAENNALLIGTNGNLLTRPGEPDHSRLQPILPGALAMPTTPSTLTTNGAVAMNPSAYRGLMWGLADGVVQSATDGAGRKIAGFKKTAPGSSVDINFVEFYWADFLRHRVVWDDTRSGSPLGSANGDANAIGAPLSFFTAVANGLALARSEVYRDQSGRRLRDYTNATLFTQNTVNWANGSLANGLAVATDTYHLYLRDDATIIGDITPSAHSTNLLHLDTATSLTVTNTLQNIRRVFINAGGTLQTAWKDTTVSNTTLRLPAGTGVVIITGTNFVAAEIMLGGGTLRLDGTLGGNLSVTNGGLHGHGRVNGALAVAGSGTLAPGPAIGTITIHGPLTLGGTAAMDVMKTGATLTSDRVSGITALTCGGTLVVTAKGDALVAGDSFKLFDATTGTGAFATLQLPALPGGLVWDTAALPTTGTIRVGAGAVRATRSRAGRAAVDGGAYANHGVQMRPAANDIWN